MCISKIRVIVVVADRMRDDGEEVTVHGGEGRKGGH